VTTKSPVAVTANPHRLGARRRPDQAGGAFRRNAQQRGRLLGDDEDWLGDSAGHHGWLWGRKSVCPTLIRDESEKFRGGRVSHATAPDGLTMLNVSSPPAGSGKSVRWSRLSSAQFLPIARTSRAILSCSLANPSEGSTGTSGLLAVSHFRSALEHVIAVACAS
jgi:hypothetical protein